MTLSCVCCSLLMFVVAVSSVHAHTERKCALKNRTQIHARARSRRDVAALPWRRQRLGGLVPSLVPPGRAVGLPAEPEGVRASRGCLPSPSARALAVSSAGQPGRLVPGGNMYRSCRAVPARPACLVLPDLCFVAGYLRFPWIVVPTLSSGAETSVCSGGSSASLAASDFCLC